MTLAKEGSRRRPRCTFPGWSNPGTCAIVLCREDLAGEGSD
jgi:hypothetical protein